MSQAKSTLMPKRAKTQESFESMIDDAKLFEEEAEQMKLLIDEREDLMHENYYRFVLETRYSNYDVDVYQRQVEYHNAANLGEYPTTTVVDACYLGKITEDAARKLLDELTKPTQHSRLQRLMSGKERTELIHHLMRVVNREQPCECNIGADLSKCACQK